MSIDTSIANVSIFPHPPAKITVTADEWRVVKMSPRAYYILVQCKTDVDYGLLFFSTPGTDGPIDGQTSAAGDYTLAASGLEFAGNTAAGSRATPGIPLGSGSGSSERPKYLGLTSTIGCDVLVWQLGGTP